MSVTPALFEEGSIGRINKGKHTENSPTKCYAYTVVFGV
jgi:hypothetical protein